MIISNQLNRYTNALIKEFNSLCIEMSIQVNKTVMRFTPCKYNFKTVRKLFKEISLFPLQNGERISFSEIAPGELMECIKRFKEWALLNGYEFKDDVQEWNRIYNLYK